MGSLVIVPRVGYRVVIAGSEVKEERDDGAPDEVSGSHGSSADTTPSGPTSTGKPVEVKPKGQIIHWDPPIDFSFRVDRKRLPAMPHFTDVDSLVEAVRSDPPNMDGVAFARMAYSGPFDVSLLLEVIASLPKDTTLSILLGGLTLMTTGGESSDPKTTPAEHANAIAVNTDKEASDALEKRMTAAKSNIRDMAKWLVAGLGSLLALAVGTSTLSQLGGMAYDWRFALALISLFAAAILCVSPLLKAIDLMSTRVFSARDVCSMPKFAKARQVVQDEFLVTNEPGSKTFEGLWLRLQEARATVNVGTDEEVVSNRKAFIAMRFKVQEAVELAIVTEMRQSFDRLLRTLKSVVPCVAVAVIVFIWAANPAKDPEAKEVGPYEQKIAWSADDEAVITKAGMGDGCLKSGHPSLFVIGEKPGPKLDMIAVPVDRTNKACIVVRVSLSNENHLVASK